MSKILEQVKMTRSKNSEDENNDNISEIWVWMSATEMISLIIFVVVQLKSFERMILPCSIV